MLKLNFTDFILRSFYSLETFPNSNLFFGYIMIIIFSSILILPITRFLNQRYNFAVTFHNHELMLQHQESQTFHQDKIPVVPAILIDHQANEMNCIKEAKEDEEEKEKEEKDIENNINSSNFPPPTSVSHIHSQNHDNLTNTRQESPSLNEKNTNNIQQNERTQTGSPVQEFNSIESLKCQQSIVLDQIED